MYTNHDYLPYSSRLSELIKKLPHTRYRKFMHSYYMKLFYDMTRYERNLSPMFRTFACNIQGFKNVLRSINKWWKWQAYMSLESQ